MNIAKLGYPNFCQTQTLFLKLNCYVWPGSASATDPQGKTEWRPSGAQREKRSLRNILTKPFWLSWGLNPFVLSNVSKSIINHQYFDILIIISRTHSWENLGWFTIALPTSLGQWSVAPSYTNWPISRTLRRTTILLLKKSSWYHDNQLMINCNTIFIYFHHNKTNAFSSPDGVLLVPWRWEMCQGDPVMPQRTHQMEVSIVMGVPSQMVCL